jgi:hypothetical protein
MAKIQGFTAAVQGLVPEIQPSFASLTSFHIERNFSA